MELYIYKELKQVTRHHKLFVFVSLVLMLSLLPQATTASNLGTLQKSNFQNITVGDTATFNILFWNTNFDGYNISLETIMAPKDWKIIINPANFYLNNESFGNVEHIYIPRIKKTMSASVITVYMPVPKTTPSGNYKVILKATSNDNTQSTISLKQERLFFYELNVIGNFQNKINQNNELTNYVTNEQSSVLISIDPKISSQTNSSKQKNQPKPIIVSNDKTKTFLFLVSFILIIFIARRIYLHD